MDQHKIGAPRGRTTVTTGVAIVAMAFALGACTGQSQDAPTGAASTVTSSTAPAGTGATSGSAQAEVPAPPADLPTEPSDPKDAPEPAGPVERKTAKPVPLDTKATVAKGVVARVTKVEAVEGEATLPGEVAGDALRVTVTIDNDTDEALDLASAIVNLFHGADDTPATTLSGPGAAPLPATVAAGARGSGTFVFRIPERGVPIHVEVDVAADLTIVAFEGDA